MELQYFLAEMSGVVGFGDRISCEKFDSPVAFFAAADSKESALKICNETWGPQYAENGNFGSNLEGAVGALDGLLEENFDRNIGSSYLDLFIKVVKNLQRDTPSFRISSVALLLNAVNSVAKLDSLANLWLVKLIRIEVSEGDKRRVIYMQPKGLEWGKLNHLEMLEKIHASF